MKHSGFTPGPWTFFDNSDDEHGDAKFSIVHNGPIAYVGENGYGRENAEANARLIADAPRLAARVERLEAALRSVARQLTGLSVRLNPATRPGHAEYIGKADAVKFADALSTEARAALAEEE